MSSQLHEPEPEPRESVPFFPHHLLKEAATVPLLIAVLLALVLFLPEHVRTPADPYDTPAHIKPEWYFFWTFRWLKLTGLTFAVLSTGFVGFLAVVWPFIDAWIRKKRPGSEISVGIGIAAVVIVLLLTVWEAIATH